MKLQSLLCTNNWYEVPIIGALYFSDWPIISTLCEFVSNPLVPCWFFVKIYSSWTGVAEKEGWGQGGPVKQILEGISPLKIPPVVLGD